MTDRVTGESREVDVVVRSKIGEHEIVVSVECLEQSRKATVSWVEQMIMKHQALPTHKLVLVSASGFTVSAIMKATTLGIEALSLDSAATFDWTSLVGKENSLPITWFEYHLHGVTLILELHDRAVEVPFGPNTQLFNVDGIPQETLGNLVHPLLQSWEKFGERAAELLPTDGKTQFGVELRPRNAYFVVDAESSYAVSAIRAYVSGNAITMPVALKSAAWRGVPLAYGNGPSPLGDIAVTLVEPIGKSVGGVATVASPRTGNPETVTLEPQLSSSSFRFIAQGGPLGFARSKPRDSPSTARSKRKGKSAT